VLVGQKKSTELDKLDGFFEGKGLMRRLPRKRVIFYSWLPLYTINVKRRLKKD
jgi:hypothetical protein